MTVAKINYGRRSFIKSAVLAGGGMILGFNWSAAFEPGPGGVVEIPEEWFEINAYLKIAGNGMVTIMSPNPEGGQNVKTAMPMIVADELDVDWNKVIVEQAPLDTGSYTRQFIGGSQALRRGWQSLRMAGATARQMLREAAAQTWQVALGEVSTEAGVLHHALTGKSAGYGEMASIAARLPVPQEVRLKEPGEFKIIGTSRKNVDGQKIVTGKPLYGMDVQREGMLIAMIAHPPAFGMRLKSVDDSVARSLPGITDVFTMKTFEDDYKRQYFDTCTFTDLVAVVGESTWEVMNAKNALKIEWEPIPDSTITQDLFGRESTANIPAGLESTEEHRRVLLEMAKKPARVVRKDGNPEAAFERASQIIDRTYTAPFLAHNCMEPMNFFADVTGEMVELIGPLQKPEYTELAVSARLGIPIEKIDIQMTRLGGGFGRRSYAHWVVEAAIISQRMKAPVKLIYSREDDMTSGIYRPAYSARYRAALDENNRLIAFHVNAGGIPESPLSANRFPAGAVENYLAESWSVESNITIGSFRAPRSNFMAAAEQSFLDEVAEAAGMDPIAFRLDLLERARMNPVGENNDYDAARYAGVLELVRDKSGWGENTSGVHRGVSAYFCHNSYVAQVLDMRMENGQPIIDRVCSTVDCGIVVNPDSASNQVEGAIVDGIGNALYGGIYFREGIPDQNNLDTYPLIRYGQAPGSIDVHFVKNEIDPTGLGEPAFPPIFAALANALYQSTGRRYYDQPFLG